MSGLSGKLAVVTGAGSGIGRAVCSALVGKGAQVIGVDFNPKSLEDAALNDNERFVVDVSSKKDVHGLYSQIMARFNQAPQILVNSAGITRDNFLPRISEEDWDKTHSNYLAKSLEAGGKPEPSGLTGSIINIASVSAKGNVGQANYSASKAGVIGFTKTSAMELSRYGIRVNCILPGFVETPMTSVVPQNVMEKVIKMIPLRRTAQPHEIANLITFLASEESSYMTGTAIDIDGGLRM